MVSRAILILTIISATSFAADQPSVNPSASPVLVELFTSEGCSSCPPADALLQELDRNQPVADAQIIVLSEHVDYWNSIGWKDPFSSRFFSDRQSAYGDHFGLATVYTPQMVVDGNAQFTGSNRSAATKAIEQARATEKVPVRIINVTSDKSGVIRAKIEVGLLPSSNEKAEVVIAIALNHAESQVLHGENGGRRLSHVAVVQSLTTIGTVVPGSAFSKDVQIPIGSDPKNLRIIAFVQRPHGQVLGAAIQPVSN